MKALLLWLAVAALPAGATRRYRWEIAGEAVGWAELRVRCAPAGCRVRWESAALRPEAAGGGSMGRRLEAETDSEGRLRAVTWGDGAGRRSHGRRTASLLAEVLLAGGRDGERRCLDIEDEESGREGRACATRQGAWVVGTVRHERVRLRAAPGALPEEVILPDQGVRFLADAEAALPARPPRLFGTRVQAPAGAEGEADLRFCGLAPEPPDPEPPPPGLPMEFPPGESCREATARYLELAAARGLAGRHAVGVAFDGAGFVWHEWAEVQVGGRWVAVDPAFRQAPAAGLRFVVARRAPGDAGSRAEAGRRVLACWGHSRISRSGPGR